MKSLSPDDQRSAGLAMVLKIQAEMSDLFGSPPDHTNLPTEIAEASERIQVKLTEAVRKAQEIIAANPPDPETVKLMEKFMKSQKLTQPPEGR